MNYPSITVENNGLEPGAGYTGVSEIITRRGLFYGFRKVNLVGKDEITRNLVENEDFFEVLMLLW